MTTKRLIVFILLIGLAGGGRVTAAEEPIAPLLTGLGSHEWQVTTAVPRAQQFFNQGLRLLYAFNHPEAQRAFREAARLDPKLAMAFWGQAMTVAPNLNAPLTPDNARQAYAAVQAGMALRGGSIAARARADRGPGDEIRRGRCRRSPGLDRAYAAAMGRVATAYPDDPDVLTLYADAVMNTMPWDYWQKDGSPKAETTRLLETLERVDQGAPETSRRAPLLHPPRRGLERSRSRGAERRRPRLADARRPVTWCTCRRTSTCGSGDMPTPPKRTFARSRPTRITWRSARRRGCIR